MERRDKLDIWSKGEVVAYIQDQEMCGEVKDCALLKIEKGHTNAYYPKNLLAKGGAQNILRRLNLMAKMKHPKMLLFPFEVASLAI